MSLFKKHWTPEEADEWTVHDLVACVLSALSFLLVTVGLAGTILLQLWGFISLGLSLLCAGAMMLVIDPKLKALSEAFEKQQEEYLKKIEKRLRWESKHGH